jgi:hypothetical protein
VVGPDGKLYVAPPQSLTAREEQILKALEAKREADRRLRNVTGRVSTRDAVSLAKAIAEKREDIQRAARRERQRLSAPTMVDDRKRSRSVRAISGGAPGLGRRS